MSSAETAAPSLAESLASALVAGTCSIPEDLNDSQREALAWALKDAALACWNTNQAQVATVEAWLRQLLARGSAKLASPIPALTDWVAALAAIAAGRMSEADSLLQQAASKFRALGLAAAAAQTQVPRVLVLCMQGRLEEAEQCGIAARDELNALGDVHSASRVSLNLGQLSYTRSDFGSAINYFEDSAVGFQKCNDPERALQSSIGVANALDATGKFVEALQRYDIIRDEAIVGEWPVLAALSEESVALIYLAQGKFAAALSRLESARREYERLDMPQHLANAERQLGQAYLDLNLLPEATALLQASIVRSMQLEMHMEAAWARIALANALARQQPDNRQIEIELSAAEHVFSSESQFAGQATARLARAENAIRLSNVQLARMLATNAEATFLQYGMPAAAADAAAIVAECNWHDGQLPEARNAFLTLLSLAREKRLLPVELRALTHLGQIARLEGDRDAANVYFESAIALVETQRRLLTDDELQHAFLTAALVPYRESLRLELDGPQPIPSDVVAALERYRARTLADRLGSGGARPRDGTGAAGLDELQHRLAWLRRRLRRTHEEGTDASNIEAEIRLTESEYLESRRRARLTEMDEERRAAFRPLSKQPLADVQTLLSGSAAIVEFGVVDNELFACVVDSKNVRIVRHVAAWDSVTSAIRRLQFQIEAMRASQLVQPQHQQQLEYRARLASQQLYKLIWAPLASVVAPFARLLVVPHGRLGAISFAALHDGSRYLADYVEVAVAPSIAVATQVLTRCAPSIAAPLVLAETVGLPNAETEANALAKIFPDASIKVNGEATTDSLRHVSPSVDCIHIACHGVFRSDNAMFSALELCDGNFSALDAEKLRLGNSLVVLSACESGLATETDGDEVFGLVRAFLVGGAARVVASLWSVDDNTTVEWMIAFYHALQSGADTATAISRAQRRVREHHPHPFHWAAFATFGGW